MSRSRCPAGASAGPGGVVSRPRHYFAGFDFGTTTSACVMASAEIQKNAVNGRMEFSDYQIEHAPEAQFTPLGADAELDLDALDPMISGWIDAMADRTPAPLHGGAIVTGLSA